MTEETKELKEELSKEERAAEWVNWIKSEMFGYLDFFLPLSEKGAVRVSYSPVELEVLETGPVYDDTRVDGVTVSLVLKFEEPVDISKPRE